MSWYVPVSHLVFCGLQAEIQSILSSEKHMRSDIFKRVVPKGHDHMLGVITISLYMCVQCGSDQGRSELHWLKMISDHH